MFKAQLKIDTTSVPDVAPVQLFPQTQMPFSNTSSAKPVSTGGEGGDGSDERPMTAAGRGNIQSRANLQNDNVRSLEGFLFLAQNI